ncbi:hypothetical protein WA158_000803 [Blastocystis sp. Blastoise]
MKLSLILLFILLGAAIDCATPNVIVKFDRKYGGTAREERLKIYEGPYSEGNLVAVIDGNNMANMLKSYEYCLKPMMHSLIGTDGGNSGWSSGSTLTVSIGGVTILYDTLERGSFTEWTIYPSYALPKSSQWKYSTAVQSDSTWTQSTYDVTSWSTYSSGSFPTTIASTTRYYRTTITLPDLTDFATFELGINAKEGMIVYINGQELFRRNMADDAVLGTTLATNEDTAYAYRRITHSIKKYLSATNQAVIAVEIHPAATTVAGDDSFDGFFIPIYGTCSKRTHEGVASGLPVKTGNESADKAFDNNRDTKWFTNPLPVSLTYQFNDDRREWISKYEIISGNDSPGRDPKDFTLSGSNDNGVTWDLLDINAAVTFSARKESKMFLIPSNAKAYNMYKIDVTTNKDPSAEGCQFSEVEFYACNTDIITDFVYEQSSYTWYKDLDSVYLSPHSSGLKTFALTSPTTLPEGLTFNPTTGEIYGTPTVAYTGSFVITAVDVITSQTVTCTLSITIIECDGLNNIHIQVIKASGGKTPWSEIVTIYDSNNNIKFTATGLEGGDRTFDICLPAALYTLEMKDIDSDAWHSSSSLTIKLIEAYDSYTIFKDTLVENAISTSKLNLQYLIERHNPNVLCYTIDTALPTNWYTTSYTPDTNWTPCLALETRPTSPVRTQFFRHTFTVTSKTDMHMAELRLKAAEPVVVYINDNEVYRHGLPTGDITTTTIPTTTSTSANTRRTTIDISRINIGTNTISIAQVYPDGVTLPVEVSFDFSLRLEATSATQSHTWGMTATGPSRSGEGPTLLIDNKYSTRWIYDAPSATFDPFTISISYSNAAQYSYINKYCFISNFDVPQADPSDWTIQGCNNDVCTLLGSESNVMWRARTQRQCFYMNAHTESYHSYNIIISKNVGYGITASNALAEIQLLAVDFSTVIASPLSYTPNTIVGYKDADLSTITPVANYHSFSIIGTTLPNGIYIDSNSGYIYGIPTIYSSTTQYTVQAYNLQGIASTTTISITISGCSYPNTIFKIKVSNPDYNYGEQMGFELRDGTTNVLIDSRSYFPNYSTTYYSYCKPEGSYKLLLLDEANDGWGGATIAVLYNDNTQIVSSGLTTNQAPKTVAFNINILSSASSITWTYLNSNTISAPTDSSWTTLSYTNSEWSSGTIDMFTAPVGITQYYRTIFSVTDINNFISFTLNMKLMAGAVVYINGMEIKRYNMPEGTITSTTTATSDYVTVETISEIFPLQFIDIYLVEGQNVLAIETHKGSIDLTVSYFSASASFSSNTVNMVINGVSDGANENGSTTENIAKVFDGSVDTKWLSPAKCVGAWASWTYNNNQVKYIDSYSVTNANDCNVRHPSGWVLEGSNDNGSTWTLVHTAENQVFTAYKQTKSFDFIPTQPYNCYRVTSTECANPAISGDPSGCSNSDMQLSEISFSLKRLDGLCSASNGYSATANGEYAYKSCNDGTDNKKKTLCTDGIFGAEDTSLCAAVPTFTYPNSLYTFTINTAITPLVATLTDITGYTCTSSPSLPTGLVLDTTTCGISGTPSVPQDSIQYTITATSGSISVSTSLSIVIENVVVPVVVTITYSPNIISVNTNIAISAIPTVTGGTVSTWTITPSLPEGILLDTTTGTITGSSTVSLDSTLFTISAIPTTSTTPVTTTITLIISTPSAIQCPLDGVWPATNAGVTAITSCNDSQKEGQITRLCAATGVWENIIDSCTYIIPTVTINPSTIIAYINEQVIITPVTQQFVTSWSVTPDLPNGFTIDSSTGIITGTPTTVQVATTYTITATNPTGNGQTSLFLTISAHNCPIDGVWPATNAGVTATSPCTDSQKEGQMTRVCDATGVWESPVDGCTYIIPTVTITPSTVTLYTSESSTITPVTQQYVSSWTVTPSLPNGLTINSSTGIISGTPTTIQVATIYTITATNPTGNGQATVSITINSRTCAADGVWSVTNAGVTATSPCTDSQKEGQVTRICGITGVWESPVDGCTYIIPTVTISPSSVTLYTSESSTITPTTQQYVSSWTVTPSLPNGLTINSSTGIITGTPTTIQVAATYIVKATNIVGFGQASISITINSRTCPLDGVWSTTNAGATATSPCTDSLKEGQLTRICGPTGIWQSAIDSCTYKAPVITLDPLSYTFYKDENAEIIPTAENQVNSWIISPSLPIGMNLNSNTGMISGSPSYIQPAIQYTLSALNSDKSALISVSITVISRTCDVDGEWPATYVGTTAYILCENSLTTSRSRACTHIGNVGQWEAVNTTTCYSISNEDKPVQDRTFIRLPIHFSGVSSTFFDGIHIHLLQNELDNFIATLNIPNTKIYIESIQNNPSVFYADNTIITTRVECDESQNTVINEALVQFINMPLLNALRTSSPDYNQVVSILVTPEDVTVTNYTFWSTTAIVVTVIVIIVVVAIIIVAVYLVMNKNGKKGNKKPKIVKPANKQKEVPKKAGDVKVKEEKKTVSQV